MASPLQSNYGMSTKILIIEDEESISFAIKAFLERRDYLIDVAVTFSEAEIKLNQEKYDLVITDLSLGGRDATFGMEFVAFLHSHFQKLKILVLSGKGDREITTKLRKLGANLYLKKPVPLTILIGSIEILLKDPLSDGQD